MIEPPELTRFLLELERALNGRRRYKRRIVEELHAHALDVLEATGATQGSRQDAIARLGAARTVAAGFNSLRARRNTAAIRSAGAVLAICVLSVSAIGIGLVRPTEHGSPRSPGARRPSISQTRAVRVVVLDPGTGHIIAVYRST